MTGPDSGEYRKSYCIDFRDKHPPDAATCDLPGHQHARSRLIGVAPCVEQPAHAISVGASPHDACLESRCMVVVNLACSERASLTPARRVETAAAIRREALAGARG